MGAAALLCCSQPFPRACLCQGGDRGQWSSREHEPTALSTNIFLQSTHAQRFLQRSSVFYFLICFSSLTRGIRGSGLQWLPSTSLPCLMLTHPLQLGFCLAWARLRVTSPGSCPCLTCTGAGLLASPTRHPPLWEAHGASPQLLEHPEAALEAVGTARALPLSTLQLDTDKLCFPSLRQTHVTNSQLAFGKLNKQTERRL